VPLPQPSTAVGRDGLAALVADPGHALLCLDFDGTLAPIVPDPDRARAHPDIPPVLERLAGLGVRVAVVTGRPAALAVDYGRLGGVAGLVVLGHYGLERWERGHVTAPADSAGVAEARRRLPELLRHVGVPKGTWVEDKGRAVAVHTRRTPDPQTALDALRGPLATLAAETGLVVEPGRMVLELRPAGADKGVAVRSLVESSRPSAVAFIGDDLGDLPAFAEVARLRADGLPGLLVCSGSTEVTELADRADLVVDGPEGVAALLRALADEMTG
jgi:trehalose 6-phosphate phosphatase